MKKHGKKYRQAAENREKLKPYPLEEAISLVKESTPANFDETVDVVVRLGVNPRHADQMVRGSARLPHGTGKTLRVLVFAKGEKALEAEEAGADFVGDDDLLKKVQSGWLDFDKVVATPDMMGKVGKLGRILGPRGMMPNPKLETVTFNVKKAVEDFKKGKVEFRVDKVGNLHAPIGKKSFSKELLQENFIVLLDKVLSLKPPTSKGAYLRNISLSTTMGPGVRVDPAQVQSIIRN